MATRTIAQKAATARLVALNAARSGGALVVSGGRRVARRASRAVRAVGGGVRTVVLRASRSRAIRGAGRLGGAIAVGQAKILPGLAGGYGLAKLERQQRVAHATGLASPQGKSGALIKDPLWRLAGEAVGLALIADRTSGFLRDAAIGASGAVGALAEVYMADSGNPNDGYRKSVLADQAGI